MLSVKGAIDMSPDTLRSNRSKTKRPEKNAALRGRLQRLQHLALDLDGTLYLGGTPFKFTVGFLQSLRRMGIGYTFFTNNSSRSARQYVSHLEEMGIPADVDMIYSSTHATIEYLGASFPDARRVFALGTPGFGQELTEAGYTISAARPELVLVGFDTDLTYSRLSRAAYWIKQGLPFIATHPDLICPTDRPLVLPDCGAICQLLTAATGRSPDAVLGKPNVFMLNGLLRRHGLKSSQVAMVGDRMYTDMAMAREAGAMSVLVLTGETNLAGLRQADYSPDVVIEHAGKFGDMLREAKEVVGA
jgi:HAD superfamily hydrolase (TIGR01450 family)